MIVHDNGKFSGPLIDILDEAGNRLGYKIQWYEQTFKDSFECLKQGCVDIVPRVVDSPERHEFVNFLGPIGYQQKDILFVVRKGKEKQISQFSDLAGKKIGMKSKTVYFQQFNDDTELNKISLTDDHNLSRMFVSQRIDTIIVLDRQSIIKAFEEIKFTDYAFAEFKHKQVLGNFYGMSRFSPRTDKYSELNNVLQNMREDGTIEQIYLRYNAEPPLKQHPDNSL